MVISGMRQQHGFTLIELAVVLVVIGLIIGGILIGQSLIRNSELQSIISDVNRYKNAVKMFNEKYKYLPGDLSSAETFWGSKGAACTTPVSASTPSVTTCNGNGDGHVGGPNLATTFPTPMTIGDTYFLEALYAWQHLANGGFIDGAYSGAGYPGYKTKVNIPESKAGAGSGFVFFYSSMINNSQQTPSGTSVPQAYPANYRHIIEYGQADGEDTGAGLIEPALSTLEAYNIDNKTDDGIPSSGNVLSFTSNISSCTTSQTAPAEYNFTAQGRQCSLIFITGF